MAAPFVTGFYAEIFKRNRFELQEIKKTAAK